MPDGHGPEAPPAFPKSLVLAAHGSRCGGVASALRLIASRFEQGDLFQQVLTSFHQGLPAFGQVPELVSGNAVVVVPVFLAEGYYSKKVLPRELLRASRFRPIDIWLTPVVGCDSRLGQALLKRVRRLVPRLGWNPERTAVVVLGHGTPRSATSSRTTHEVTAFLRSEGPCKTVHAAFLDERPTPREALQGTDADHCVVLPWLFGSGDHAGELAQLFGLGAPSRGDSPEITGRDSKGRDYVIDRPIGEDPVLVEIIGELVRSPRFWKRLDPWGGVGHVS
jgi:sirohydrochlorin cobaltochelatase